MSRAPQCIRAVDGFALRVSLCLWCQDAATARGVGDEYEARGYTVTMGLCTSCLDSDRGGRGVGDSLRNGPFHLAFT